VAAAERWPYAGRASGVFSRPASASAKQLAGFELSPQGIHWDELDEDLSLEGFLSVQKLQPVKPRSA